MRTFTLSNSWQKRDLAKIIKPYNQIPRDLSMSYVDHFMGTKQNHSLPAVIRVTPSGQAIAGPLANILTPR